MSHGATDSAPSLLLICADDREPRGEGSKAGGRGRVLVHSDCRLSCASLRCLSSLEKHDGVRFIRDWGWGQGYKGAAAGVG